MAEDDWSGSQSNTEVNQEPPPIEKDQQKRFVIHNDSFLFTDIFSGKISEEPETTTFIGDKFEFPTLSKTLLTARQQLE